MAPSDDVVMRDSGSKSPLRASQERSDKEKEVDKFLRMSIEFLDDLSPEQDKELTPDEQRKQTQSEIRSQVKACVKASSSKESRFIVRTLRKLGAVRKQLTASILKEAILLYFPKEHPVGESLQGYVEKAHQEMMDFDDLSEANAAESGKDTSVPFVPEVQVYLHLLVIIWLVDARSTQLAKDCSLELLSVLSANEFNKRTIDPLRAKAYFYYYRSFELVGETGTLRNVLLEAYRTATLRHDAETQGCVLNLLLRNYLEHNLYDQAYKLVSKTTFKEVSSSSGQVAKYLYYTGRIKAVQLDYTESYKCLMQAIRKAPQQSAFGFRKTVQKLCCIVQLLMGEIPEKSVFHQPGMKAALTPYYELTRAVRVGDLAAYKSVVKSREASFHQDRNFTLIQRLRRNVIKTGLRKINLAYSRISLADICSKLHLDSVADAEYIVAKAIRDRVIDATIDHEQGYLQSRETVDIYSTQEPLEAFHRRISFCLNLHNDAVMAQRFPTAIAKEKTAASEEKVELSLEDLCDDDDDLL